MNSELSTPSPGDQHVYFKFSVLISWLIGLVCLALAGWIGALAQARWGLADNIRFGLQAFIMSGLLVPGIWLLRTFLDQGIPKSIGVGGPIPGVVRFLMGTVIFLGPLLLCIAAIYVFGLGKVAINWTNGTGQGALIGLATVFFFEALPEELLFRGYVYSHLNTWLKRWKSALLAVGLFALLPVALVPIQKYLLGMDVYVGGSNAISPAYVITMIFFGAFVQYLRILTGSIWAGIGFHLMFVYMNRLMGPDSTALIQFKDVENESPIQIIFIGSLLLVFLTLILYPLITKRKIGWGEKQL